MLKAEQEDTDLQPGRPHDPDNPTHIISDSESSDSELSTSPHINRIQLIQNTHRIHPISSSDSSAGSSPIRIPLDPDVRRPLVAEATSSDAVLCRHFQVTTNLPINVNGADWPLGAETTSKVADSVGQNDIALQPIFLQRLKINYNTLDVPDDEYLLNNSSDSDYD